MSALNDFAVWVAAYFGIDWNALVLMTELSLRNNISIPIRYYQYALLIGFICGCIHILCRRQPGRAFAAWACVTYMTLVLFSTVLTRPVSLVYQYELQPFWSYYAIHGGDLSLFVEDFLNLLMLIPIGLLLPIWSGFRGIETILSGFICSMIIELGQLILKRGLFEFDDLFHNTLGCAVGYGIFAIIKMIRDSRRS